MTYRHFTQPRSWGWGTHDWTQWLAEQDILLDVRPDIPEGVCSKCYGATSKTQQSGSQRVADTAGGYAFEPVLQRWSTCYKCDHDTSLQGLLPISYSVHDRLESAIYWAKNNPNYIWLNLALASLLHSFLMRHWECIERRWGEIGLITTIPSHPSTRNGWDHLRYLISTIGQWPVPERWDLELLCKTSPDLASAHREGPRPGLFRLAGSRSVANMTVLLIDDTFTGGSTLRSAAAAINAGGGRALGVTIGRQVRNNEYGSYVIQDALRRQPHFDLSRCAIHP